jgi:histidine triad (HIT) family protein
VPADCVFCDIVTGLAAASVVFEDPVAVAIMDIQPMNPGHVLVIPKRHLANLAELDDEVGAHVFKLALRVQDAIRRSGVRCEGVNLFVADGESAGQDVFHFHLHVVPRYAGDSMKITFDSSRQPAREELDRTARAIARALR